MFLACVMVVVIDCSRICSFIVDLVAGCWRVRSRLLRAGSRVDGLPLSRVRKRARAVLKDEVGEVGRC